MGDYLSKHLFNNHYHCNLTTIITNGSLYLPSNSPKRTNHITRTLQVLWDYHCAIAKTQKLPHKTPKNQKSKKDCSSELILETKNFQTHKFSKQKNQKYQKLKNYPLNHPKT